MDSLQVAELVLKAIKIIFGIVTVGISFLLFFYFQLIVLHLKIKKSYPIEVDISQHLFASYVGCSDCLHVNNDGNPLDFLNPLKSNSILVLQGERGSGKTVLLQHIYNECCSVYKKLWKFCDLKNKKTIYLPIYIDKHILMDVENPIDNYLQALCHPYLNIAKLLNKDIPSQANISFFNSLRINHKLPFVEYKILLCIDGFNEFSMRGQNYLQKEMNSISVLKDVKIIVTTRYMPQIDRAVRYTAQVLEHDNVREYVLKKDIELNEKELSFLTSPLLAVKYVKWKVGQREQLVDQDIELGMVKSINSSVDILWNAYCTEIKKAKNDYDDIIYYVLLKYFLPYIAGQLENDLSVDMRRDDFSKDWYYEKFKGFIQNIDLYLQYDRTYAEEFSNQKLNRTYTESEMNSYLQYLVMSVASIKIEKNGQYTFVNDTEQMFLAAVYLYNLDVYSLYNTEASNVLSNTTMGKCFRFFYSRLMYNLIEKSKTFTNQSRWNQILSDLYYYGDGVAKDKEKALELSWNTIGNRLQGDFCSINWHKWNIFFITFEHMKSEEDNTERFLSLFKMLNESGWEEYYPLYDKLGFIFYNNKIYQEFKKALDDSDLKNCVLDILQRCKFSKKIDWSDYLNRIDECRTEIMQLFFEKAAFDGKYHYAYNKLGKLCEDRKEWEAAFVQYKQSYLCDHSDYFAISKMLQLVNNNKITNRQNCENAIEYANKAHAHVQVISPIMDCKGIQGYPMLLTALGDYYYLKYQNDKCQSNKCKDALMKAFDRYKQNVCIKDDEEYKFYYEKSKLIVSFLCEKYSEEFNMEIGSAEKMDKACLNEFQINYSVVDSLTAGVIKEFQTILGEETKDIEE